MLYRPSRRDLIKTALAGSTLAALGSWPAIRAARAQGSTEYELIDLGAFEIDVTAPVNALAMGTGQVRDINTAGVSCGSIGMSPERRSPATWSTSGKLKRLESGQHGAFANRINAAGNVVGYEYVTEHFTRPVAWLDGERTLLAELENAWNYDTHGAANDINDDGVIVGLIALVVSDDSFSEFTGVRWVNGEVEVLTAPDGTKPNSILRINEQGTMLANFNGTYALWNGDEVTPVALPDTDLRVFAIDLTDDDQVVSNHPASDERSYGYVARGDEVTELASLDDEELSRLGRGINNDGVVVGETWDHQVVDAPRWATRWIDNEPVDLNTLIPEDSALTLTSATAINDDGMICGLALDDDGVTHGFVLMPV